MSTILRLRQAVSIIEAVLREARGPRLSSDADVLILGLLADQCGISGAELARRAGRERPNTVRSLHRLHRRGLVEPYESVLTLKTCGWGLTQRGEEEWVAIAKRINSFDSELRVRAPQVERLAEALAEAMHHLVDPYRGGSMYRRLLRPPRRAKTPDWDL